jgi:hypothetical protein
MDSNMPAPKPEPKSKSAVDEGLEIDLVSFTTPEIQDAMSQSAVPLDRGEIMVSAPEHGKAYNAARQVVHTAVEKCDTRPGLAAQALLPPVAAGCATAYALDHLDKAYDKHLVGDNKAAKELVAAAGQDVVAGMGTPYQRAASSLIDAARVHATDAEDGPTAGDHLRTAALSAVGIAAGGRLSGLVEPALLTGDALRRSDADTANQSANATLAAGTGLLVKAAAGRVAGSQASEMAGNGADVLASAVLPKVEVLNKKDTEAAKAGEAAKPSTAFLSFLSSPAPAPKRLKLPTPYDN